MQKICVVILLSALLSHYEAVPQTKWSRPIRNTQGQLTRERRQFSFGEWVPLSHPCPTCRHFADPLDSGLSGEKIGLTPPRPPTVTRQIHGEANFFPDESSILSVPPPPPSAIPRQPNGNFQFSSFGTQFNNPLPTQQIFPQTQQIQFLPQSFLPNQQVLVNNQQILPGLNQQQNNVFGQEQSKQQVNTGKVINFNNNFKSQKIPQNVVLEQNNRPVGPKQTFSNKPQPFAPQQQSQQQSFVQQQSIINQPQHSFAFGSSILTPPPAPNNSQNIVIPGLDKEEIQLLYVPVETLRQRGTFQQQQLINQDSQNLQFQNRPNGSQRPLNNIRPTEQTPTTAAKGHFVTQNRNNVGQTIGAHQVTTPQPFSSTASPSTVLFQNIPFQQTPQPFVSATPVTPTIQPFVTPSSAGQTFSPFTPETTLPQLSTLPNAIQFSPQDIEFGTTPKTILSQGAFQGDIVNGKSQFSAFKSTPFVNQEQPKPTQQTFSNQQNTASPQPQQGAFFQEQKEINGQNIFSQQTDQQQVYLQRQQDQQRLLREQEEKERQTKLRQQKELEAQRALQRQKELDEQRFLEQQRKQKELEAQRLQQRQKELEEQRFLDQQRKQKEQKEQLLLQQQRQKELEQQRYLQQQRQKELEQQRILLEQQKELEAQRRLQLQRQKELEEKRRLQQLKQKQEEEQQRLLRIQQQQQQQREEQERQKLLQKQQEQQRLLLQQKLQREKEENIRKQQQIQYLQQQQQKQQKQLPQQQVFQQTNRHVLPANDNLNLIPQLEKEGELENNQLVPHQPPLSVFYRGPQKAESQIVDVLRELRSSKTIIVLDQYFDKMPKVFVGPAGLIPPNGYRKFDLPYLSNLETNTIEKRIDKLPFFVAPVNFVPPPGYAKILFPAPHVGSVVVSSESNPAMKLGSPVKDATVSSGEEENDGSFPMVGPELPGLINSLETETTTTKPVTFASTPSLPQTTAQLRNKRPNNSIYKPQNRKPISRTRVQTTTAKPEEEVTVAFQRTETSKESEGIRKPFNRFLHRRRQQTTTESSLKAQGGKSLENRHYSVEVYHQEKNANQVPETQDKSDELENKQTVEYQYNEGFGQQTDGIDRSTPGGHGVFRVQPTPDYYKIQSTASSAAPEVRRPENSDYSDVNLQTFEDGPLPTGSAKTITHELYRPNSIRQSSGEVKYNSAAKPQVGSYEEVNKFSELPVSNPTATADISSSKEYSEEQYSIPSTPVTKPESQNGAPEITYSGEVSRTEVPQTPSPNFSGEEQTKGFLGSNEEYTSAFAQLSKHHQMTRPTDSPKSHHSSVRPTQQVSVDFGTPVYQEQQSYELGTSSEEKSAAVPTQFPIRSPSQADFSQFNENSKTEYVSGGADILSSPISPTAPGATQEFYTTGLSVNSQTQNSASINQQQEDQRIGSFISVGNVHSTAESPRGEVQYFPSPTPSTFQVTVTENQKYPEYSKHVSSTPNSAFEVTEIPSAQTYTSESTSGGVQTLEVNGQNVADGESDHELKLPNPSIVRVRTRGRNRSRGQVNFAASQSSTPAPYTRSKIEHKNNENSEQEQGTKTSQYQPVKSFKTNQYRGFKKPIRTTTESVTESEYKSNVYTIRPQRRPLSPSTVSTKRIRRPTSPLPSVESATEGFGVSTSDPHYQSEHSDFSPSGVSNDVYYEHSSFSPIRQKFRKFNEAGQKSDVINVHRPSSTAYPSATPTYSSVSPAEEQEDTSIIRNPEPVYEHSSLSPIRQKFRKFNEEGKKGGVFGIHRSTAAPAIYPSATPSYPTISQSESEEDTSAIRNPEPVYEHSSLSPVRQKFRKFNEAGQKSDEINIHGSTPSPTIYPSDPSSYSAISEADVQEDTRTKPESASVEVQEHSEKFPEWNPSESGFDVSGIVLTTIRTTSQEDHLEDEEPKKYQDSKKAFDPDLEKKSGRRRVRVRVHKRPHENFETAESQNLRTVANVLVPPTSTYKPNDETSFHQLAKNSDFSFGGQKLFGSRSREYFRKRLNLTNAEENKGAENAQGENSESKSTGSAKDGETQRNEFHVQTNGANEETKISRPKFRGFVRKIIKHGHAIKEESKSSESSESEDADGKHENVDFHLRQQIRANHTGRFNGTRHKTLVRFVKKNKVRTHESEINQDSSSQEQQKEEQTTTESHPVEVSETSSTESEIVGVKEEKEQVQETVQPTEAPETQHTQRSDAIQTKATESTEQSKIRRFQLKTTQAPKVEETAEVSSEKPEEATSQAATLGTPLTPQGGLFLTQRPKFYQTLRPLYYRPSQSGSQRTREYTSTTEQTVKDTQEKKETPVRPKYGKTSGFGSQESGKQEEVKRFNEQRNKNQHTQEVRKYLRTKSREGVFSQFSKNKYYTSQKIEKEVTKENQSKEKEEFTTPLDTKGSLADIEFPTNEETTESGPVRTESVETEVETTKGIEDSEIPTTTETVESSSEEEEEEGEESSEEQSSEAQSSEKSDVTGSVKFEETTTEFKTELPTTIFQSSSEKATAEVQTEKSENFDTQPDIYRFSKSSFSFDETEKFTGTKNRAHVRNITTDIIENTASFSAPGVDKQPEIRVVTRRLDEKLPTTTETQTDVTSIQKTEETTEELNTVETTTEIPETAQTQAVDPVTKAKLAKVLKTSTTTKISHETEICYKGKCIRTKSENPDEDLKKLVDSASIMKIEKTKT